MSNIDYRNEIASNESLNWNVRDEYQGLLLEQLHEICDDEKLPFAVCVLSVTGELNVGMIMRSASLLGAEKLFLVGRRKYDKRSAVGVNHYLDIHRISMLNEDHKSIDGDSVIDLIEGAGYAPVAVEGPNPHMTPQNVRTIDWCRHFDAKPCLILGSEGDGLPETVLARSELVVSVMQRGVLRSFNVSAAAAITMHEVASQLAEGY